MTAVKTGDTVSVHYTGRLNDGTVFDSSEGREPLQFKVGDGMVIPGFEQAVTGMKVGEKKTAEIPVDQAYGPREEGLVMPVPKNQFPPEIKPEVGQQLQMGMANGQTVVVRVAEVGDETVTLDANPPLAGHDLVFDLELVAIA